MNLVVFVYFILFYFLSSIATDRFLGGLAPSPIPSNHGFPRDETPLITPLRITEDNITEDYETGDYYQENEPPKITKVEPLPNVWNSEGHVDDLFLF
jgi:hypothetical protein